MVRINWQQRERLFHLLVVVLVRILNLQLWQLIAILIVAGEKNYQGSTKENVTASASSASQGSSVSSPPPRRQAEGREAKPPTGAEQLGTHSPKLNRYIPIRFVLTPACRMFMMKVRLAEAYFHRTSNPWLKR